MQGCDDDLGRRLLELLGERGCVELLAVLEPDEPERAALIGRLHARGQALAEVLIGRWGPDHPLCHAIEPTSSLSSARP